MQELIFVDVNSENESLDAFLYLLPTGYEEGKNRRLIGCCDKEGNALGIVELLESFDECEILWIYVEESVRGQGIGHALINEVLKMNAKEYGFRNVSCQIRTEYIDEEYNPTYYWDEIYPPIRKLFAEDDRFDEIIVAQKYDVSHEAVKKSEICQKIVEQAKGKKRTNELFFDLPTGYKNVAYELLEDNRFVIKDKKEFEETCIKDLCFCRRDDEGIVAIDICRWADENTIEISFVYTKEPNVLMSMVMDFASVVIEKYPGCDYTTTAMNDSAEELVEYLSSRVKPSETVIEYKWNYDLGLDLLGE